MVHSIAYSKISKEELIFLSRYPKPILENLVLKKIISKEEIENFIGLFKHFNISIESYYPENYLNEFKNNFFPEGYFQVVISNYPVRNNLFIDEIQKEFKIKRMNNEHGIDISLNQFCQFIYKYNVSKEITWYDVCCHPNIPWTNELIIKYRNVWYWETLHRNSSIIWNFELIEKAVDYLNWAFISSYEYLIWDTLSLTKYKDYIIFSIDPDKKWKRGYNKKGKKYSIYGPGESFNDNIHSNLKGSLSLSESIDWSKEIIDCVLDYWDWEELASNKSIAWDEEMIEYYSKKLDFKSLSSNPSVKWNERLIEKYKSKWDWKNLSGNLSLPWSYEFIERYEKKWQWKLKNYYNNISDESNFQSSISTNPSIMWNIKMLSKWERRLDFWRIARRGNLQDKALKRFYHKFDRKELVGWTFHKCSDFRADEKFSQPDR